MAEPSSADSASADVRKLSPELTETSNLSSLLRHIPSAIVRLRPETFGLNN
jgi:hypothetical protein